jgi:hypothetical protein
MSVGVSSAYLWELENRGIGGAFLIKKTIIGEKGNKQH